VPVLAGSAAYAVAETFQWKRGLDLKLHDAREFYAIVALATLCGVALNFAGIDPIKALFWSAVINGVVAVPIMSVMMLLAGNAAVMGQFTTRLGLKAAGWLATAIMAAAVIAMMATWSGDCCRSGHRSGKDSGSGAHARTRISTLEGTAPAGAAITRSPRRSNAISTQWLPMVSSRTVR
jgi:hypothetical protein